MFQFLIPLLAKAAPALSKMGSAGGGSIMDMFSGGGKQYDPEELINLYLRQNTDIDKNKEDYFRKLVGG